MLLEILLIVFPTYGMNNGSERFSEKILTSLMRRRNETFREMRGSRMHSFGPSMNRKAPTLWKVSYQQSWHSKLFWSCWLDTRYLWGWDFVRNQIVIRTFWCDTGELETNSLWNANTVSGTITRKNTIHKLFAWHARTRLKIIFGIRRSKMFWCMG